MNRFGAWRVVLSIVGVLTALYSVPAWSADADANNERWKLIRKSLFAERSISEDAQGVISLDTPVRAADASVVPISIRAQVAQSGDRFIRKVYLVIDRNPSPAGATFTFTALSGRADIETRVRIEEYTHVRAIAEMNDGSLVMQTRYVKASGGCSAPAAKDMAEAMSNLGKMKLRVDGTATAGRPTLAQLMVNHPNTSGLAIDQLTRLAPTPHYIRTINVSYGGQPVVSADVDFTISENPSIRFYFTPDVVGELKAEVADSTGREFETAISVKAVLPNGV